MARASTYLTRGLTGSEPINYLTRGLAYDTGLPEIIIAPLPVPDVTFSSFRRTGKLRALGPKAPTTLRSNPRSVTLK